MWPRSRLAWLALVSVLLGSGCRGLDYRMSVGPARPSAPLVPGALLPATVTASTTDYASTSAWRLVDGSGMSGGSALDALHDADVEGGTMWRSAAGVSGRITLHFDLGAPYPLGSMVLWNYNRPGSGGAGLRDIRVYHSVGGFAWTELAGLSPRRLAKAGGLAGEGGQTIDFGNVCARHVKIVVDAVPGAGNWGGAPDSSRVFGLSEVRFYAGTGLAAFVADDWTGLFVSTEGWVGADGIYTIPLSGRDRHGARTEPRTLFLFSDTFLGSVDPATRRRRGNHLVNNTLAILEGVEPWASRMRFIWGTRGDYTLESVFSPLDRSERLVGSSAANLGSDAGMTGPVKGERHGNEPETMWLSAEAPDGPLEITLDLRGTHTIREARIWNYNDPEHTTWGLSGVRIEHSLDGGRWAELRGPGFPYVLRQADGGGALEASNLADPPGAAVDFGGLRARYVRFIVDPEPGVGNWSTRGERRFGLSQIGLYDAAGDRLFAAPAASSSDPSLSPLASSTRFWLQDGIVVGDTLYLFPLLVRDRPGAVGAFNFQVIGVADLRMPLVDGLPEPGLARQTIAPLYLAGEDVETMFGAGILDNTREGGSFDPDGYVYVYGHATRGAQRNLVAARAPRITLGDFNTWRFWDGETWVRSAAHLAPLAPGVSPELSVTSVGDGLPGGRFILVYMRDGISGSVCYRMADTPVGPFSEAVEVYVTPESLASSRVFTYNAKAHPHLSAPGELLISYNVNSSDGSSFEDATIYRPRFLRLAAVAHGPTGP